MVAQRAAAAQHLYEEIVLHHGVAAAEGDAAAGAPAAEVAAVCGKTSGSGSASFFVSDSPVNFDTVARVFLGGETIRAQKVDIEAY